jgi:hypothetical protein
MHESPEPFGMVNPAFVPQDREHPQERLLANVFNGLMGSQRSSQLNEEQFAEIRHKVAFCLDVPFREPLDVFPTEWLVLQVVNNSYGF